MTLEMVQWSCRGANEPCQCKCARGTIGERMREETEEGEEENRKGDVQ